MIIKNPLSTEKAMRLMESQNSLVFMVDRKASKPEIKEALESKLKVKIKTVRTLIGHDGKKRAYAVFDDSTPAIDVATKLGLM